MLASMVGGNIIAHMKNKIHSSVIPLSLAIFYVFAAILSRLALFRLPA